MTLRDDYPAEPCDECREWCLQHRGTTATVPVMARDYADLLEHFAEAARWVHGGSAGREIGKAYVEAAGVLRQVWGPRA